MIPKTVDDCWAICNSEADRYQSMIANATTGIDRVKYTAKRDQSKRIARLIRFGTVDARPGRK